MTEQLTNEQYYQIITEALTINTWKSCFRAMHLAEEAPLDVWVNLGMWASTDETRRDFLDALIEWVKIKSN